MKKRKGASVFEMMMIKIVYERPVGEVNLVKDEVVNECNGNLKRK